ncbi:hypothetical protein RsTz2092_05810 [Deferribacterales bacterium RsTz2092]|nr:hypothetical protein AGMMS49941_05930 [Deferribacterales bacterium]
MQKSLAILALLLMLAIAGVSGGAVAQKTDCYLYISNWETDKVYIKEPIQIGDTLFFGWMHSLEHIPWNEYYHIDKHLSLVLDAITFPAFGAGIPEDRGNICYIKDGLIHMEQIDESFGEIVWLNSHYATRELKINGQTIATGSQLPEHTRLRLVIGRQ